MASTKRTWSNEQIQILKKYGEGPQNPFRIFILTNVVIYWTVIYKQYSINKYKNPFCTIH